MSEKLFSSLGPTQPPILLGSGAPSWR